MRKLGWLLVLCVLLAGCAQEAPTAQATPEAATAVASPTPLEAASATLAPPTVTPPPPTASPATATAEPPTVAPPTATPEPPAGPPPEPQTIAFTASDGQELVGVYYPGAADPSPIVVLMHWARGDAHDWDAIAPWLQNRGLAPSPAEGAPPWLDSAWFPPMPEGRSYAVFTFTFRGCEGSCAQFDPEGWLLDAQAAMRTARALEGVDSERMVAVGASIGGDGAADGCLLHNDEFAATCLGALSLSPGSYLGRAYAEVIQEHGEAAPMPLIRCAYADGDAPAARDCRAAQGERYAAIEYAGDEHGMMLVQPDADPPVLPLLLDFLEASFSGG